MPKSEKKGDAAEQQQQERKDPYTILGVGRNSTEQEIKSAYRKLALKYHPDKNSDDPIASDIFKEVTHSYNILSDPDKRRKYDALGYEAVELESQELEVDLSSLGTVNTMFAALFSKLGIPIRTTVSTTLLEEALNGRVTIHPLNLGQSISRKVEKQCAHFYSVEITEQEAQMGFVCRVHSAEKSKFKVVKRAGPTSDVSHSEIKTSSKGKRPVRERLGSNIDDSHMYGSHAKKKRQRTDNSSWSSGDDHFGDDKKYSSNRQVGRDDLRHKLARKGLSRRNSKVAQEQSKVDLREKLSRNTQVPLRFDTREHPTESRASGLARRIPPTRSADNLLAFESLRKSYSPWTLDGLRRRSPDKLLGSSRGLSPPRNYTEMRHIPSIRPIDVPRPTDYTANGVVDASRSANYLSKPSIPVDAAKPVSRAPLPGNIIQKTPYMLEEPVTVSSVLSSLGLGKYAIIFQAEEVDMPALKQMGDSDLKELGIPMGPRKKILLAVSSHSKQRHRREGATTLA